MAEVVHIPMVIWAFTLPRAVRGVRLIVMYIPPMIKKLMALFFGTEAIAWSAGLVYGVDRQGMLCVMGIYLCSGLPKEAGVNPGDHARSAT